MVRGFKILFIFFSINILLSACSDTPTPQKEKHAFPSTEALNKEQERRYEEADKPLFIPFSKVEESLENFKLTCEDCPNSFGQLISRIIKVDPDGSKPKRLFYTANCQGGMIGENLFLTSLHCIPEDIAAKEASCSDRIKVILPELDGETPLQVLECEKVLSLSEKYPELSEKSPKPDWAIIELKQKVEKRWAPMDKEGINHKELFYSYIPLVNAKSGDFKIKKITCKALQSTIPLPDFSHPHSPIARFKCNTPITSGFSGTLLYRGENAEATPVAVMSHNLDTQVNKEDILISSFSIASNVTCLPPEEGSELHESCQFHPGKRNNLKEQLFVDALKEEKKIIQENLSQYLNPDNPILWELTDLEKIDSLPQLYQVFFKKLLDQKHSFINDEANKWFFQTMVPIYPVCLKKDFIPDFVAKKETHTTVPVITLIALKNPDGQLEVQHRLKHLQVSLFTSPSKDDHYTFHKLAPLKPFNPPRQPLKADRFSHLSAEIPVCP